MSAGLSPSLFSFVHGENEREDMLRTARDGNNDGLSFDDAENQLVDNNSMFAEEPRAEFKRADFRTLKIEPSEGIEASSSGAPILPAPKTPLSPAAAAENQQNFQALKSKLRDLTKKSS